MRNFAGLLFGGSCFLCRGSASGAAASGAASSILCAACDADLPRLAAPRCPRCALDSPRGEICGRCLAEAPRYDATLAALAYRFPADALVQALKFRGELALGGFLADLFGSHISTYEVDRVIAVPLSAARLRERGYNPAVEIARRILPAKLDLTLCERSRDTPPQMELPLEERRRNVRGAFRCTRRLAGQTVAVVDDVMTTGATLDEVAGALKAAGATRVVNWVVARTL
jgi:ComF family protein